MVRGHFFFHLLCLLVVFSLPVINYLRFHPDTMFYAWLTGLIAMTLSFFGLIKPRLGILTTVFGIYLILSGLNICQNRLNLYERSEDIIKIYLSNNASMGITCILLLSIPLIFCKMERFNEILSLLGLSSIINSIFVILGYVFHFGQLKSGGGYSGFIDHAGVNGSLIALTGPSILYFIKENFFLKKLSIYWILPLILICLIINLFSIALSNAAIPYAVCGITWFFFFCTNCTKWTNYSISFVSLFSILGLGLLLAPGKFINDNHRFEAYKVFMGFWYKHLPKLFGGGLNVFKIMAPGIQVESDFEIDKIRGTGNFFPQMHSDWLQLLFENGVIGEILFFLVFLKLILIFKDDGFNLSLLMGMGALALFNYPVHHFITAFIIIYLIIYGSRLTTALEASADCHR